MNPRAAQTGMTTVELTVVGLLAMVILFGVLEIARVFFVFNALEEAARRGARVAAVCQVNDPRIAEIAAFSSGGSSRLVSGLTPANVEVEYLDVSGNSLGDPMASFGFINFVRVSITGYTHRLMIPLFVRSFTTPSFATTLPAESLGVWPGGYSTC